MILGVIWTIILRYQIQKLSSGSSGSTRSDLLEWARKKLPECGINDFRECWKDGRAICHLSAAVKPGCFPEPLGNLVGRDALRNIEQGLNVAETELGVPRIIAPAEMLAAVDELSVITYLSYFRIFDAEEATRRAALQVRSVAFRLALREFSRVVSHNSRVHGRLSISTNATCIRRPAIWPSFLVTSFRRYGFSLPPQS
jgi:hypothetical protein